MHLYIAGDSMMGLPGMALVNLSNKTKLIKPLLDYHISTGLVRPDFFNWPAQLQQQVRSFDPGRRGRDVRRQRQPGGPDRRRARSTSSAATAGRRSTASACEDTIDLLFGEGVRRIYWIGQPVMPSASFNGQIRLMNDIYSQRGGQKTPGCSTSTPTSCFSNGSGQYSQYLPDASGEMQQVREQDGEHLTYAGGLRIAQAVIATIKDEWFPGKGEAGAPPSRAQAGHVGLAGALTAGGAGSFAARLPLV